MITVHDFLQTLTSGQNLIIYVSNTTTLYYVVYMNHELFDVTSNKRLENFDDFIVDAIGSYVSGLKNVTTETSIQYGFKEKRLHDFDVIINAGLRSYIMITIHE